MFNREIMAVCSEIHTKHINAAVWAERRILHVKTFVLIVATGGTYSDHCAVPIVITGALKGKINITLRSKKQKLAMFVA